MARSMWKGSIAFGLVNIPIELYSATRDHRPKFRLLHAKDEEPVRYERVCQKEGKPVAWQDLVKGFEYAKNQFVVITKDDFKTAAVEKTKTIDIMDFVDPAEIDERYFETPYYLLPGKGGDRAYALLREAIRASGRIGIAKFILRESQHLAAIEVIADGLVLSIMRFADELVDAGTFTFPSESAVRAQELEMARMLVENLAASWDPAKYTDDYRENLMKVIRAKLKGKPAKLTAPEEKQSAEVVDLMERLRRSLAGGGTKTRQGAEASRPKRARAKKARRATGKKKRAA